MDTTGTLTEPLEIPESLRMGVVPTMSKSPGPAELADDVEKPTGVLTEY